MSIELDELYPLFKSPMEKQLADMRNQLARSRFQKDVGDTQLDLGSLGLNSENYIKAVNTHYNIMNHNLGTSVYYPAFEPDNDKCKLWINTDHFGYEMVDDSLISALNPETQIQDPENPTVPIYTYPIGQDVTLKGEPKLESGFDRGYGDPTNTLKRQALHFNRLNSPTIFNEYMKVRDQAIDQPHKDFRVSAGLAQTWIVRIKSDNFDPNGGYSQRVLSKIDNDTNQDGILCFLGSTGRCVWQIRRAGVDYAVYDASFYPVIGTEYEYALVWNPAGATTNDKMHIYRDGVLKTNTVNTASDYGLDPTDHDLYIGKRGAASSGYFQGHIILVKMFQDFLGTDANILSHYTNKLTIAGGIGYGQVAVPDISVPRNL